MDTLGQSEVVRRTWQEIEPELSEQGYELVEVQYIRQGSSGILRFFIDKEGGVTLNDCQSVSQVLSVLLDAADFIEGRYVLEVSSPGFNRPVRKPADFERFAGERIEVQAQAPIEGRKRFKGVLSGFRDGMVMVDCDGHLYAIHIENVKKAHLDR